jgi:hypothetical protein
MQNVKEDLGTKESTKGEVMFRASNDRGETFENKTNLSYTETADSVDAEIAAEGATVMITWWERNQTSNVPVARISTDAGETFGTTIMLGTNCTLTNTEEGAQQEKVEKLQKKNQWEEQKQQSSIVSTMVSQQHHDYDSSTVSTNILSILLARL